MNSCVRRSRFASKFLSHGRLLPWTTPSSSVSLTHWERSSEIRLDIFRINIASTFRPAELFSSVLFSRCFQLPSKHFAPHLREGLRAVSTCSHPSGRSALDFLHAGKASPLYVYPNPFPSVSSNVTHGIPSNARVALGLPICRIFSSTAEAVPSEPRVIISEPREMLPTSVRVGAIAIKCGMTSVWNERGLRIPITILWIDDNQVIQVKTEEKEGIFALQVGSGQAKAKQISKPEMGHFRAADVPIKRKLAEFRVTEDALLPVGTPISVRHFAPGQYIDITGITTGKGFQGVMKRHGFKGMPASHGASLSHRSGGSTGGRQDPGKVFKNKKMAGQMGAKQRTVLSVWVYRVDPARNLLWVKGQVPGHSGNFVLLRDGVLSRKASEPITLPFPTFLGPELEEGCEPLTAKGRYKEEEK
eukprot:TRINITY_DN32576_c0_g1_i1.p1 TRINITY_DN32576_c0_g1~~TRINITY_DN32576_c0_g1_i1.p1  ORF type:complete len:417 (+),score=41.94 TRINITY_DN32576_c0_g1_i1:221-1471(+)